MTDVTSEFEIEPGDFRPIPVDRFGTTHFNALHYVISRAYTHAGRLNPGDLRSSISMLRGSEMVVGHDEGNIIDDLVIAGLVTEFEYRDGSTRFMPTEQGLLMFNRVVRAATDAWSNYLPVAEAVSNVKMPRSTAKRVGPSNQTFPFAVAIDKPVEQVYTDIIDENTINTDKGETDNG